MVATEGQFEIGSEARRSGTSAWSSDYRFGFLRRLNIPLNVIRMNIVKYLRNLAAGSHSLVKLHQPSFWECDH